MYVRDSNAEALDEDGLGEWGSLKRGGPNGLFIVMIVFWWWGSADGALSQEWKAATTDLRRCLERLAVMSAKRPPEAIGEVGRAERLKRRKVK